MDVLDTSEDGKQCFVMTRNVYSNIEGHFSPMKRLTSLGGSFTIS